MAKLDLMPGSSVFSLGETIIKKIWPDKAEQSAAILKLKELEMSGDLAQMGVNAQEAQHESLFVAGWRPFTGWACGLGLAYMGLVQPFLTFVGVALGVDLSAVPEPDTALLIPVLMGMLGLGYMRTDEKNKGSNKRR